MKKLLLVSATTPEIEPLLSFIKSYKKRKGNLYAIEDLSLEVLITGVGMVQTAFELGKKNGNSYDLVIHAGVAGSFHKHKNGEVVLVTQDRFSELGAQDDLRFISIDDLDLGMQEVSLVDDLLLRSIKKLPRVKGITVNTVHGNTSAIKKVTKLYHPDIESMECAAFMLAASEFGWRALEIRAISNQVEKRNKAAWELRLAITNLNRVLIETIQELSQ